MTKPLLTYLLVLLPVFTLVSFTLGFIQCARYLISTYTMINLITNLIFLSSNRYGIAHQRAFRNSFIMVAALTLMVGLINTGVFCAIVNSFNFIYTKVAPNGYQSNHKARNPQAHHDPMRSAEVSDPARGCAHASAEREQHLDQASDEYLLTTRM